MMSSLLFVIYVNLRSTHGENFIDNPLIYKIKTKKATIHFYSI